MANANPFTQSFAALGQSPPTPTVNTFYGTIPQGVSTDVNDLFESLLAFTWRTVSFPVVHFETELRQDLVIHKFADRDSAHIEGCGRHPIQITAYIPELNGLARGQNETWYAPLYPDGWRALFAAFADRSSGPLQHPELGLITCKPSSLRTKWEANVRSGVYAEAVWIESDDTTTDLQSALSTPSPAAQVSASAADIDLQLSQIDPSVVPKPYVPPVSFTDLANAVRGAVDQTTLLQKQYAGQLDNLIYEANALKASLDASSNALNWPLYQSIEALKASCYDLAQQLLTQNRTIGLYLLPKDATFAQIATMVSAPITDIIILNAQYMQFPVVSAGTMIRYYSSPAT